MIEKFITWLKAQVGSIYVWGAQGEVASDAFIRSHETSEANANRALNLYNKRKAAGKENILAYDCSGLVIKFLLDNKLIDGDTTAEGISKLCATIPKEHLQVGDLVFRKNSEKIYHVGVYIGKDKVIHSRGRDYGVVEETLTQNGSTYWNAFGRYEKIMESEVIQMATKLKITSPLMRSDAIRELQDALNRLGYDCGEPDGICGKQTLAGVEAFCAAHCNLPATCADVTIKVGSTTYTGTIMK